MKRKAKKARNPDALAMVLNHKGGYHQRRCDKRAAQKLRRSEAGMY